MSYKYKPIYWQRLCCMSFEHFLFQMLHCFLRHTRKKISIHVDLDRAHGKYLWSWVTHNTSLVTISIKICNLVCQVRWRTTFNGTRLKSYEVYGQLTVFFHLEPCTGARQPTKLKCVCVRESVISLL